MSHPTPKTAQAVITCNGSLQHLSTYFTVDQPYRYFIIHHLSGGNPIYFGFDSDTSETDHVWRIPSETPPYQMEMSIVSLRPTNIYFKGTNGEQFSIGAVAGHF